MSTRYIVAIAGVLVAALVVVSMGLAASAPRHAALVIRHQTRGCHS